MYTKTQQRGNSVVVLLRCFSYQRYAVVNAVLLCGSGSETVCRRYRAARVTPATDDCCWKQGLLIRLHFPKFVDIKC
jgi:hypothetical protein